MKTNVKLKPQTAHADQKTENIHLCAAILMRDIRRYIEES